MSRMIPGFEYFGDILVWTRAWHNYSSVQTTYSHPFHGCCSNNTFVGWFGA